METDDVLWPYQSGVVEVAGFEIERVEGFQTPVFGVVVAADNAHLQTEPRLPRCIPSVTGIHRGRPGQDGIVPKSSHLHHLFRVIVPALPRAKFTGAERMPMFVAGSRGVDRVLIGDAQIIKVNAELVRCIKPMSDIQTPERRVRITAGNSAGVLSSGNPCIPPLGESTSASPRV